MRKKALYSAKVGFMTTPKSKKALEQYSKDECMSAGTVCRKALNEYLKKYTLQTL